MSDSSHSAVAVPQVMVSSTFTDLKSHRAAAIKAINANGLHPNVMEHDGAKPAEDIIGSSLKMVRESAGYLCVISLKYGQIPKCPKRNPKGLSITELEFNEALHLGRPILLFIMSEGHRTTKKDIENQRAKERKLNTFRERAKNMSADSVVHRIYDQFKSLSEFRTQVSFAIPKLIPHLRSTSQKQEEVETGKVKALPKPPAFHAEPDYIGSHKFIGRARELEDLDEWAKPADPTNVLLFEAIGGNGKSMLTWEWARNRATKVRKDWAGRFWYSFYERGAVMADFCRRALAYMTERPVEEFNKKKTPELAAELLAQLHARPWLLILDGLERVLVAYHRFDAASVRDEDANQPTDQIAHRNPCDAIREEDSELLRTLAAAAPSKILVSSRLTPRVLLNKSGQPVSGVKKLPLSGLRPADAEALLKSCGIKGKSAAIRDYLTKNCDNHPLVIGILAGLINDYLPDRGNFDAWVKDTDLGGAQVDLASLELIQRRNHILRAAIQALPEQSGQLLSTLALLSEAVDYETLKAFNPHEGTGAERKLAETVKDLERRGLLQYDGMSKRYDLHPVVRGVAAGDLKDTEKERYGQRVVDHFSAVAHSPWEEAETLEDLRPGLNVVRTLLELRRHQRAAEACLGDLSNALLFNVEGHAEALSLLRPFFSGGWGELPQRVEAVLGANLATWAAIALGKCGEWMEAQAAYGAALRSYLKREAWSGTCVGLRNIAASFGNPSRRAKAFHLDALALDLAKEGGDREDQFMGHLFLFWDQALTGRWAEAEASWQLLDPMGRGWLRAAYRPGSAERCFAWFQFWRGALREEHLAEAERLATEGRNRFVIRDLHGLRGAWRLEQRVWALAAASFREALRMARESGLADAESETGLALARYHLGELAEPRAEAERLADIITADRYLALLWREIGDLGEAKKHALAQYRWAWSDGEPFVYRYELTKAAELLKELGEPLPDLPPYDPAKEEKFPWEDEVREVIERLRREKEMKEGDS